MSAPLLIARTLDKQLHLLPLWPTATAITGATGTGKTVTLQSWRSRSRRSAFRYLWPMKGDLTGIAESGQSSEKLQARLEKIGATDWQPHANPVVLWDIFGEKGRRCAPRFPISGPCCWLACSTSMRFSPGAEYHFPYRRRSRAAAARLLKTCAPLPNTLATTPKRFRTSTAISAAPP